MRATGRVGGMRLGGLGRGRARRYEGRIGRTGRLRRYGGDGATRWRMARRDGYGGANGRMGGTDESNAQMMEGSPRLATPLCRRRMSP